MQSTEQIESPEVQYPGNPHGVILCADDYAMTEGVSTGIEQLIDAGRLSATSALATTDHWPSHARRVIRWRPQLAIGLHFNLTLGAPLGPMPVLAASGTFPSLPALVKTALAGRLDEDEISAELTRQLDRFEDELGARPDMIDGHQHVHVLPQVRVAFLRTLARRYPCVKPLLRDPADSPVAITARGVAVSKALGLAALATGFGARARSMGFPTNRGFSGVSPFDEGVPYGQELERFLVRPGPLHMLMCHPGNPDEELARIDPVVMRRRAELETLLNASNLPELIRLPTRTKAGWIPWDDLDA